jgi:hypothetical protein
MNGAGFSSPWEVEGMDLLSNIAHKKQEVIGGIKEAGHIQ